VLHHPHACRLTMDTSDKETKLTVDVRFVPVARVVFSHMGSVAAYVLVLRWFPDPSSLCRGFRWTFFGSFCCFTVSVWLDWRKTDGCGSEFIPNRSPIRVCLGVAFRLSRVTGFLLLFLSCPRRYLLG
jgi:hypothetical protein